MSKRSASRGRARVQRAPVDALAFGCVGCGRDALGLSVRDAERAVVGKARQAGAFVAREARAGAGAAKSKWRSLSRNEKIAAGVGGVAAVVAVGLIIRNRSAIARGAADAIDAQTNLVSSAAKGAYNVGQEVFDAAKQALFSQALLAMQASKLVFDGAKYSLGPANDYAGVILQVADEKQVSPFLIVGFGAQESKWGAALTPPGPGGTGDWTARGGSWVGTSHTRTVETIDELKAIDSHWTASGSGPWAIPEDGRGWGRGLLQIDYKASLAVDWTDPYANISAGVDVLQAKERVLTGNAAISGITDGKNVTLSTSAAKARGVNPGTYPDPRPLDGDALVTAEVASYNTGEGNVIRSLAAGVPADTTTAGGQYAARVLSFTSQLGALFSSMGAA